MNASVSWLNAFVAGGHSAAQLRDLITAHTATVEEMVALREDLAPIVVARVVEEALHPDSDHLHITKVDAGTGELLDVVCGAPNVTAGRLYPFAPTGTTMLDGKKIEKRKIRGQTSNGMLCSARELGLGEEHEGILELDLDVAPGTPFLQVMPVGDSRLVIDVLPNRPDLLSHLGVAREVAAITGATLAFPDIGTTGIEILQPRRFRRAGNAGGIVMHLEDAKLASRYMGVVIRGVKVGPSPAWLAERLAAVGSRSINNIVDASNYVLHEIGQPTHAFDLNKIDPDPKMPEKTIVIRRAKDGETLVTLDGVKRILTSDMTVIADSVNPIALAGVMGGSDTEVDENTTDLFIEVANFDTGRTRRTRRGAGLSTDASYRFERGVDVALAPMALYRVASLIIALAGGSIIEPPIDLYAGETPRTPIILRTARVARVLGVTLDAPRIAELLKGIGCAADVEEGGASIHVIAPTWRQDIVAEVDLLEEVARLHGYDALPGDIRPYRPGTTSDAPLWTVAARLRDELSASGLYEARPTPFVAGGDTHVLVLNPLAENEAHLRRTLLESLARRAEYNLTHMQGDVRLYEIGSAFEPGEDVLPVETVRVAALIMGNRAPAHFTNAKPPQMDAWDAKALAERIARIGVVGAELRPAEGPDALWEIVVEGEVRGHVSRVPLDAPVWASQAFGIELELGRMFNGDLAGPGQNVHGTVADNPRRVVPKYRPLPAMPASEFDLALLVPDGVLAADVERVIRSAAGDLLERLVAFDVYEGAGVDAGHRSVAWRLTLRHPERTLRDKEIEGRRSKILTVLNSELNVRQRST
jgi:phenylalanyl-tRNA synthetase beta chain